MIIYITESHYQPYENIILHILTYSKANAAFLSHVIIYGALFSLRGDGIDKTLATRLV